MNKVVAAESHRTPSRSSTMVGIAVAIRNQAMACSATPKLVAQTIRALSPESSAHIVGRAWICDAAVTDSAADRAKRTGRENPAGRYRAAGRGSWRRDRSAEPGWR